MRTLLALLALLLATAAQAQQRQSANVSTLPQSSPQEFDLLDNQGRWMPFGTASGGIFFNIGREISPVAFGAKCDGVTDDTTALQAWASSVADYAHLVVPGTCKFTDQIVFSPLAYGVSLEGGTLLYAGASTTLDPVIQIGQRNSSTGCAATKWSIRNLEVISLTAMTAGDGLRLSDFCLSEIDGLTVGGTLGRLNTNWWNAIRYDGGNGVHTKGFNVSAKNDAVAINGDTGSLRQFTDPMFLQGIAFNSAVGVHICGAVGGFEADQTSVVGNGVNVLIDRTCVPKANVQLFFGPTFASDVTASTPGIGVHVSDPGGPNTTITYRGWLASATNQCFVIDAGATDNPSFPPQVNFLGATIGVCHAPTSSNGAAIENQSTAYVVNVIGTRFFTSPGGKPTIYNVSGAPQMGIQSLAVDVGFNISGAWAGSYLSATGLLVLTGAASVSSTTFVSNGPGAAYQWRPQGGTQPTDQKNWDMFENASTGDITFRALNDAFAAASNYVTYTRGSGYSLTGASVTMAPPVFFSQYVTMASLTYATLPTCVGGQAGRLAMIADANAPAYGTIVTSGGGVTRTLLLCNGTNWTAH